MICKITRKLTNSKSDCVGLVSFAGATLDFRALANGATALEQRRMAAGAYAGNIPRFENIELIGPGRSSETIGIASQTANTSYRQFNVNGFGHGFEVRSGSWLNHFTNSSISDCAVDLYCGWVRKTRASKSVLKAVRCSIVMRQSKTIVVNSISSALPSTSLLTQRS